MKFRESRFGKDTMQVDLAQLGVVDLVHETCMAQWDRFVVCGQLEPFRNDKGTRQQSHALTCILLLRSSRVQWHFQELCDHNVHHLSVRSCSHLQIVCSGMQKPQSQWGHYQQWVVPTNLSWIFSKMLIGIIVVVVDPIPVTIMAIIIVIMIC